MPSMTVRVALLCLLLSLPHTVSSALSPHHAEMVKQSFLRKFGIENVPRQSGPSTDIPDHMWQIYDQHSFGSVHHFYPSRIETFGPAGPAGPNLPRDSRLALAYNLSVAARQPKEERVERAILKLKVRRSEKRGNSTISLFFLRRNQTEKLVCTRTIDGVFDGWVDFDVSDAFRTYPLPQMADFSVTMPSDVDVSEVASASASSLGKSLSAAFVVFSDSDEPDRVRRKRNIPERKSRKKNRKHHRHDADMDACRKTELYVDFDELNWQDWIMAPKGYTAGQCVGACRDTMSAHLNASNHAIIQSLMHSLRPDEVPPPCCVPTETSPLSILYIDVDNTIVIKEYADMRVEACGCR